MKTKKLLSLILMVVLFLSGCDKKGQEESKGKLFGVTFQTLNNPFFVDLNKGLKEVVEANGDRLVTLDAQWNSLKQRNDISDLIMQGASAIFINPVNWKGIKGSLLQAKEKSIPCIVVDALRRIWTWFSARLHLIMSRRVDWQLKHWSRYAVLPR